MIAEYLNFSRPKSRILDEKFIEAFDTSKLTYLSHAFKAPPWYISASPAIPVEDDGEYEGYHSPTWCLHSSVNRVNVI